MAIYKLLSAFSALIEEAKEQYIRVPRQLSTVHFKRAAWHLLGFHFHTKYYLSEMITKLFLYVGQCPH